jgi:hypothetical protein
MIFFFFVDFVWIFDNFFGGFCLKQMYERGKNSSTKIEFLFFVVFIYVVHDIFSVGFV